MVSRRKLKFYDAKSLKLLYLLMLAVFPYEAGLVTDLRTVKADQQQLALALWSAQCANHQEQDGSNVKDGRTH